MEVELREGEAGVAEEGAFDVPGGFGGVDEEG